MAKRQARKQSRKQAPKKKGERRERSLLAFKRSDVVRAVRAMGDAGLPIGRVEIDRTGRIVIVPKSDDAAQTNNEVEDWITKNANQR